MRVLLALLVTALVAVGAAPASAAPTGYVALGDSYSSGTGTRSYLADGTSCQRSVYAYPSLIAASRGYSLSLRACSGARVGDVAGNQLNALNANTGYVTISVGGNDADFAGVLTQCALPAWMSDCFGRISNSQNYMRSTLPNQLRDLYAQIKTRAPQARVSVVGYPRLFNGTDCNAFTWFSPQEQSQLNATADLLNSTMAAQARAAGFSFANPTQRFVGHAVCDNPEWVNGLSNPIAESYHPNRAGHASGYLPTVNATLGRLSPAGAQTAQSAESQATRTSVLAKAEASRQALTQDARAHAAKDSLIVPERVEPVDLHSPQALAAAERAGVDVDNQASVDLADQRESQAQAAAHGVS